VDLLKRDGVVDDGLEDVIRVDFWFLPWLVDGLIKKDAVVDNDLEDVIRVDFWFLPWLVDGLIKKRNRGG